MLAGEEGEARKRAIRLLYQLGLIYQAKRLVEVESVQVSGVSYKSIGDPGLAFLQDFASLGARARVATWLNPAGIDLQNPQVLRPSPEFIEKQTRIIEAYASMGIQTTATCTPYLLPGFQKPKRGAHLAWAESSAVAYANSVLGARTNREGGPSSLAAALCGCTPEYGLHLEENRQPHLVVYVKTPLRSNTDFGALGIWSGKRAQDRIPVFVGLQPPDPSSLRVLGAAMAASGAVALFYIEGVTEEYEPTWKEGLETHTCDETQLKSQIEQLSTSQKSPDCIAYGCPHASLEEIERIAHQVRGRRLRIPLFICTARATKQRSEELGLVSDYRTSWRRDFGRHVRCRGSHRTPALAHLGIGLGQSGLLFAWSMPQGCLLW